MPELDDLSRAASDDRVDKNPGDLTTLKVITEKLDYLHLPGEAVDRAVRRAVRNGDVRHWRPGRDLLVSEAEMTAWVESTIAVPRLGSRVGARAAKD